MFAAVFATLLAGYAVAPTLAGVALLFAFGGALFGVFDIGDLGFLPSRVFGIITNQTLIAVPLFVLMGVTLQRTHIAETLLKSLSTLLGSARGGLGMAVIVVGMLMAASTGIVGATVVTMGLISLPAMLRQGYDSKLATGTICATGTLGQIIPPSIALVLLGDVLSSAYQQAQLTQGVLSPKTVSVGDLFAGAILPGTRSGGHVPHLYRGRGVHQPAPRAGRKPRRGRQESRGGARGTPGTGLRTCAAARAHRRGSRLHPRRLRDANRSGGRRRGRRLDPGGRLSRVVRCRAAGDRAIHAEDHLHGLPHPRRRFGLLPRIPRLRRRRTGARRVSGHARRGVGRAGYRDGDDIPVGLRARLHRNHLRRCSDRWPRPALHGESIRSGWG